MAWRLVRENVLGITEFSWNRAVQREVHLSASQIEELEAGNLVHTPLKGGTDYYLINDESPPARRRMCPMCGGTGNISTPIDEVKSANKQNRGKIA